MAVPAPPRHPHTTGRACFVREGNLIYATNYSGFLEPGARINCRDAATGELRWNSDKLNPDIWLDRQIISIADKTVTSNQNLKTCIVNQTGQIAWQTNLGLFAGNETVYAEGEYLYDAHYSPKAPPFHESTSLVRAHHATGHWDTLYTLSSDKNYPRISNVSSWVNPQGDSIVMLTYTIFGEQQGQVELHAFNLRTRQVAWVLKDFDNIRKGASIYPPLILGNRLYLNCSKDLHCIDLLSGSVVWSSDFTRCTQVSGSNLKEYGNTILLVTDNMLSNNSVMPINKTYGSIVWENKEVGARASEVTLLEGILYHTSSNTGRLYAIDAASDTTIWNMESPNIPNKIGGWFGTEDLCIDPVGRRLYVTDGYFIMCVELAK